ncbi:DUF4906 domain-containing protein [Alistipes ihumii]|uniref:DUF4906 domain-containing protein n=1 Tax=Alistipes ihumii TaxID=1470347 RepID=UPI00266CEEFD|nr:DUF4906 domain-containing protein [Alistipes ihumii]
MHIRNMIPLLSLFLLAQWALAGCNEAPEAEYGAARPTEDGSYPVTLRFEQEDMQPTATRAADENAIRDLNLWTCGTGIGRDVHLYIPDGKTAATFALIPDNYHFYAVANAGRDLGDMDETALQTLAASFSGEPGTGETIPMAARGELHISGPASLTLRMERLVAKLSLTLSVASALQGALTVESVQLLSVPSRCLYFADNRASDPSQRTDYSVQSVSGTSFSCTYYLPENMAGVNSSVTSERLKDKAHAPTGASWLRIEGRHNDRPVTYSVYLGANNTTDFNVERNTLQHLNITLSGSEPSDLRVARFSLALGTPAASYLPLDEVSVPLTFTAENQAGNSFTLRCTLNQGRGRVLLDGTDITSVPVSLPSTGSSRTLTFEPSAYGQQVAFTLTVSDAEGRQVSRNLSTYIKPKGELKLSMTAPDGVTAGSRSIFPITVSEENYAGTFRLRLSTATASSVGSFYFQGRQIAPGVPVDFTVAAGTHNVEFAAANAFGGDAALTATVTDDWSESRSVTRTASVSPDIIVLHPKLNVETVREYPIDSLYTMMPYVNLKVVAGQAVPTAVTVTVDVLCTGRYTGYQGGQKTYPVTQSVTIPAGSTVSNVVHLPWPMGTPTYYISDNMPADPGYAYESVSCRPGAITPSSYGSIVFQLNAD